MLLHGYTFKKSELVKTYICIKQGSHSLEKSLNFFYLECGGLERLFDALWLSKTEYKHSSENLKVIYVKCSMFYEISNYQLKTSELKTVDKMVKQTVQAFKSY